MRTTLSHALGDSAGGGIHRAVRTLLCMLVLALLATACQRDDADPDTRGEPATSFEWPSDPSHPHLRIEIDGGAFEGQVVVELMPELAPYTVARIADLAKNGYYDGTTFHRVIPGFMIQGGDPNSRDRDPSNDGYGDSDLRFEDEFGDAPFVRGVVALANTGRPDSTGGQLFILLDDQRDLDGRYTVIGRVVSGMETVDAVASVAIDRSGRWGPKDRPIENVSMKRVTLEPEPALASNVPQGTERAAGRE